MSRQIARVPQYISGFMTALAGIFFIIFPETVSGILGVLWGIVLVVAGIAGAVPCWLQEDRAAADITTLDIINTVFFI